MMLSAMGQDSHGCVLDGGYIRHVQKCLRIWDEACPSLLQTDFLHATQYSMVGWIVENQHVRMGMCNENSKLL